MKLNRLAFAALAVVVSACSHDVPKRSRDTDIKLKFDGPMSVAALKINADLSKIRDFVLPEVPKELRSEPDSDKTWSFQRQTVDLTLYDGRFQLDAKYRGRVETRQFFQNCILDPVFALVAIEMTPGITAHEDEWVVRGEKPQLRIDLGKESVTTCTMFNVDVTSQVKKALNDRKLKEKVLSTLEAAKVGVEKDRINDLLNSKIAVDVPDLGSKICLYPQLEEITFDRFEGTLERATLHAQLRGHPFAIIDRQCPDNPRPPDVELKMGDVPERGKFRIVANVAIPYDEVTKQLRSLEGKTLTFDAKTFWIERISAANAAGNILIKAFTRGYIDGEVHIWGKPKFDGECSKIRLVDIDFAARSGGWLDSTKIVLGRLRHASIVRKIASKAVFDISDQCKALNDNLAGEHKVKGLTLSVSVEELKATEEVTSRDDAVVGKIIIAGTAEAEMSL